MIMRKYLQYFLKNLARLVMAKYDPEVVGITGSIGKTGAKNAVTAVLSRRWVVRASPKNYNNELGLPLTIIGIESGGRSPGAWLMVVWRAVCLLLRTDKNYPEVLVLELGVDKPGDMDYLLSMVKLRAAVLTYIGSSHLENFGSHWKLIAEKKKIFNGLAKDGWAIVNLDNEAAATVVGELKHRALTYGFNEAADVRAQNVIFRFQDSDDINSLAGVNFKIKYQEAVIPILLPGVIGQPAIYASLAAAAVGLAFGLNGVTIAEALRDYPLAAGRMRLLAGTKETMIIDDTYNAAPQSVLAALDTLDQIRLATSRRKWIVLGDMLELGGDSEAGHRLIGARVATIPKARLLFTGRLAHYYGLGAREAGMPEERIQNFNNHQEIIDYLEANIAANDLILVKGSQGARMEKVVKALLAEPARAGDLLARQEARWLD